MCASLHAIRYAAVFQQLIQIAIMHINDSRCYYCVYFLRWIFAAFVLRMNYLSKHIVSLIQRPWQLSGPAHYMSSTISSTLTLLALSSCSTSMPSTFLFCGSGFSPSLEGVVLGLALDDVRLLGSAALRRFKADVCSARQVAW